MQLMDYLIVVNKLYTVNSEILARILFFANNVKRHICHGKNSRVWHDLPTSVKDKEFFTISRNSSYAKFRENKTLAKIFEFIVPNASNIGVDWTV